VIGLRFCLLSWSANVDAWIDDAARRVLTSLHARPVVVRPACQSLDRDPPLDGIVVADIDGSVKGWFDGIEGSVIILRPDRIVAAVCRPCDVSGTLAALSGRLHLREDAEHINPPSLQETTPCSPTS
jgi:3-(3-hydroxy-phenyl)propionate hydroxylase